jgi:bacillithiol biosynthesis cysteine-adding enzyme BshC
MKSDCLDFRRLPGFNPLFLDFAYQFEKVESFYHFPTVDQKWLKQRAESVWASNRFPRSPLLSSLDTLNRRIGGSEAVFSNLRKLGDSDTLAVLTGQQVGLFGGPAYSVYKAATAVRLAQFLELQGYRAVPVFWMASDDSDFDEVRSTHLSSRDSRPLAVSYPVRHGTNEQMAGTVSLREIGPCLESFDANAGRLETSFASQTAGNLRAAYHPGSDFRDAFGAWMSRLFSDHGLILFDPLSPGHRGHLTDFYTRAVENRDQIVQNLAERNTSLKEAGYSGQVNLDPAETLMFWLKGTSRSKIRFEGGLFQTKGAGGLRLDRGELVGLIEQEPESFSTSVLLRPVLQDYLFPTMTYVGGPAEIAYFGQLTAISGNWGLEMSIQPRSSFTLVDRKSSRLLRRYQLDTGTVLTRSRLELLNLLLAEGDSEGVLRGFDHLRNDVERRLEELGRGINALDPPVADMLENSGRKMLYQVDKVRRRFVTNRELSTGYLKRHLDHLLGHLVPLSQLQERTINFNQYLAEEGDGLIDRIIERSGPDRVGHQVLYF